MSRIQHIGQDFTKTISLYMLPGIKLKRGIYQTEIQYVTDTAGVITMHHMSQNMLDGSEKELTYSIGRDVREITFQIHCHNSYPTNPLVCIKYSMRVDRILLLNLAVKLLK